jgi:hypothetical protein
VVPTLHSYRLDTTRIRGHDFHMTLDDLGQPDNAPNAPPPVTEEDADGTRWTALAAVVVTIALVLAVLVGSVIGGHGG